MPQAADRCVRAFERHALAVETVIEPELHDGLGPPTVPATILDISAGGARLRVPGPTEIGSLWRLAVPVAGRRLQAVPFVVRWCREGDGAWLIGAQFIIEAALLHVLGLAAPTLLATEEHEARAGAARDPSCASGRCAPAGGTAGEAVPVPTGSAARIVASHGLAIVEAHALHAEVRGDLHAERTLSHCQMEVRGACHAGGAAVVGGELLVARSAEVGTLGDAAGTPTRISVGHGAAGDVTLRLILGRVARFEAEIQRRRDTFAALSEIDPPSLTHEQREQMTLLMCEIPEFEARLDALREKVSKLRVAPREQASLTIRERAHRGASLAIEGREARLVEHVEGPVVLRAAGDSSISVEVDGSSGPIESHPAFRCEHAASPEPMGRATRPAA